jgi:hypothetical protein
LTGGQRQGGAALTFLELALQSLEQLLGRHRPAQPVRAFLDEERAFCLQGSDGLVGVRDRLPDPLCDPVAGRR